MTEAGPKLGPAHFERGDESDDAQVGQVLFGTQ